MSKYLVIVESPSKCKPIEKYLGTDYKVLSSKGHIRDLSTKGKYGLGVDIENDFKPDYVTIKGKKKDIDELKKNVKQVEKVFLATDPDREGEAISWHLYDALGLSEENYDRVVFNEITKNAVVEAFKHARKIDKDLVNSQEARRILDRIIGFRLSRLIQSKTDGTSAGRVQSVALKLIVDREREIEAFQSEEYYTISALFEKFEAELFAHNHKEIEIKSEKQAEDILKELKPDFLVESIEKKVKNKNSPQPFTTSTLQQMASSKLGFSATKTMMLAQKLYEGIELADETVGLISYMRTDSLRLSDEFIKDTYQYIEKTYGKEYIGTVKAMKKTKNVQDAHEAIRPTSIKRTPLEVKPFLSADEYKLYRMIYTRSLSSLMIAAKTENTTILFENQNYQFKATGQTLVFDGYLKTYKDYEEVTDQELPILLEKQTIKAEEIKKEQHFTKPPARYSESKLIKEMEELGIGRPSTYATIVSTIKKRHYIEVVDKKFVPTETGIEITDKLQEFFSPIINVSYTAQMEDDLDKISEGKLVWNKTLSDFWKDFEPSIKTAFENMEKKVPVETGENCPNCGHPLVIRKGKYGTFIACSNYPECKYIKQEKKEETEVIDCPHCDGKIIEKKTRKGKIFYGCNHYPDCKTAYWDLPIGQKCPECGEMLVEKNKKIKCSICKYVKEDT